MKPATPLPPMVSASTEEEGCLLRDYLALPPREWEGVGADSPGLTHPQPQWCSLRHSSPARCHGVIRKPVEAFLPRTLRSTLGLQLLSLQDCFRHGGRRSPVWKLPSAGTKGALEGKFLPSAFTGVCSVPIPSRDTRALDMPGTWPLCPSGAPCQVVGTAGQ